MTLSEDAFDELLDQPWKPRAPRNWQEAVRWEEEEDAKAAAEAPRVWTAVRSDRRIADFLVEVDRRQSARRFTDSHKVVTEHVCPPIPIRCYDWQATLGGCDEDGPLGQGATEAEAIADLREQLQEQA